MNFLTKLLLSISLVTTLGAATQPIEDRLDGLRAGWNLIGTPETISDISRLDKAKSVWKYKSGQWYFYSIDPTYLNYFQSKYQIINQLEPYSGFWVNMPDSVDFYLADTNDSDMPMVLVNQYDLSYFSYFYDVNTSVMNRYSLTTDDNKTMSVTLDSRGFPLEVITNDEIIIFSNYTPTTVGVSVMNTEGVVVEYITHELNADMQTFLSQITTTQLSRVLYATASEKAQVASKALDYSANTLDFIKHVGVTLEKTGKFTTKDAVKYATKKLIVDYLKNKVKEGSVTLEVIDNVHDMLSETAGCFSSGAVECAGLVQKTLKHTTDMYEIYQNIKETKEVTDQWIKETEALLKIKKAQYLERKLLEDLQKELEELDRDPDWYIDCGDYSQKEVNGNCIAKTCKDDMYGCPSCNMLQELHYNTDGSGVCELIPCAEGEKRDSDNFCIAKTCEIDQYNCPTCNIGEELFYYTDGSGYCEAQLTCNDNQKVVNNQCIDLTCEEDNYGCTQCAEGETLVAYNPDGSGYCEKLQFTGKTESSSLTPIVARTELPSLASCPSGFTQETYDDGVMCKSDTTSDAFAIRSISRDSLGNIVKDTFYTPVFESYWYSIESVQIEYYANGIMNVYRLYEIQKTDNGYWSKNTKELHLWYDNGQRKKSEVYQIKQSSNGNYSAILSSREEFYDSGRIKSRKYYKVHQRLDGSWLSRDYLIESFFDEGGSPYKAKNTYTLKADAEGVLWWDTVIYKAWYSQYVDFISPEKMYSAVYENGSSVAYRTEEVDFWPNSAAVKMREYKSEVVQNDDGSYQSLQTHFIDYLQNGDKESEYRYEIHKNDSGYWTNVNYQSIYYETDGSSRVYNYHVIQNQNGDWIQGALVE